MGQLSALEKYVITELPRNASFEAMNSAGQLVGLSWTDDRQKPSACVWDKKNGLKTLDEFPEVASRASDINESGEIVGFSGTNVAL